MAIKLNTYDELHLLGSNTFVSVSIAKLLLHFIHGLIVSLRRGANGMCEVQRPNAQRLSRRHGESHRVEVAMRMGLFGLWACG